MAEWIPYLEAATQLKTNKNKDGEAVYVCEGLYATDSGSWGYYGHTPADGCYATVYGSDAAYEAGIMQEDGTEANETIDELANLQALVATGARRPNNQGVFISGQKYTLMRAVMAGGAGDVEELRTFTAEVDGEDRKVVFNKVFMLAAGEHQVLVAEDKQTYVYIAYANKNNCNLEKCHDALGVVAAGSAYYFGSAEAE